MVADGDDAGGVDAVVADPVVRGDAVAGGKGFGAGVKRLQGSVTADGPVGSDPVVVGQEVIELVLKFGDVCARGRARSRFLSVWWNRSTLPQVCGW